MELDSLRKKIDSVDQKILSLLNERASISINVGLAKKAQERHDNSAQATEIFYPTREKAIFEKLVKLNHGPLANESIIAIYREIMSASISLQKEVTIAFLGPAGTHTHQAACSRFGDSVLYVPQDSIGDIFTAVEQEHTTYGVVPFENSTFGSVVQTLDRFISADVHIRGETYLVVHHCLMSNSALPSIRRVYSHPEAFGQCQRWLDHHLPNVERINVSSTGYAAELASKELHSAAICNVVCSELYGLEILEKNIEDMKNNTTRFFIIGKTSDPNPTTEDRTLIMFTVDHRIPGALCDTLRIFKDFNINLTKIDSRPSGQRLWHYVFFVEMEGHMNGCAPGSIIYGGNEKGKKEMSKVEKALEELKKVCVDLRVLGSYPSQRNFVIG